uniref:Fungal lipase-type domain-containing protein n=1 Tax=Compsopogon caeruleus TaxID=31354 RepID=A0A7S1TF84_9RHOD
MRAAELILRESKTRLEEWSRLKGDDYQLVLAGHSMGAAVATLVGILLRERRGTSKFLSTPLCFAFACPPVVSRNLAIACEPWVLSFVYDLDCVPRMSVTSLMTLIGEFHPVDDDSEFSTKESVLLYPGGRIIHITSDSPARKGLMPPEDCTKILVSPRMIESHLIGNYMEKLCELAHSASSQHRDVPFSTAHSFQALKDMIQRVGINEASGSPT